MQLNPSEISDLLKKRIEGLGVSADLRTQGTVVSVTDGICRVHGLSDVMQGEMLEFPGNTYGLALNLERDSVGAVILGSYEHISEGDLVKTTGKILSVPVGPELIGRVVNVNMTGGALYDAAVITFAAQVYGMNLSLSQMFLLVATATLITIGSPGIPGGGVVVAVMLMTLLGMPLEIACTHQ